MDKRQIVNIINFIRGVEPRCEMDLVTPVKKQIELLHKYKLKGTFLLQYDALINPVFSDMLKSLDTSQYEIGVWFETVQPLVEKAGLKWTGRYPWDWHVHCGFTVGYTPEQREKLTDILFGDFKAVFGYYPKVMGAWSLDAHTIGYASDKYGLDAVCNCKDQWGTDGYTLWGGYYGQAYYPSRSNAFCPAGNDDKIDAPMFRMLGSDPVYQYDTGLDVSAGFFDGPQGVITLEPVYTGDAGGGGVKEWVDWYLDENFSGRCLAFGYTQAGQENSFGWESMRDGLEYQLEKIADMRDSGALEAETLGESGRWYKACFNDTPPTVIAAMDDWKKSGRSSVWYNCKNYRLNLYTEGGKFWIRDFYLFRSDRRERYLDDVCTGNTLTYDNLPIADGNRFSGSGIRGGLYPSDSDNADSGMSYEKMNYSEEGGNAVIEFTATPCGTLKFILSETEIRIEADKAKPFYLINRYNEGCSGLPEAVSCEKDGIKLRYCGYEYGLKLLKGSFVSKDIISAGDGEVIIKTVK